MTENTSAAPAVEARTMSSSAVPLLKRYEVNEISGCWLWLGYVNKDGYARAGSHNAHRVFYIEHVGDVPEGFDVDHLCKRRDCVNPAHLEAVPEVENIRRKSRTVRLAGREFDICRAGHPLEGENVRLYKRGAGVKRVCVACQREVRRKQAEAAGREYKPYGRRKVAA